MVSFLFHPLNCICILGGFKMVPEFKKSAHFLPYLFNIRIHFLNTQLTSKQKDE